MAKVTVGADGRVTIPRAIREQVYLEAGAELEVCVTPEGIVLRPIRDPDQWWYWTEKWQAGERRLEEDRARGERGPIFYSHEEFLAYLNSIGNNSDQPGG